VAAPHLGQRSAMRAVRGDRCSQPGELDGERCVGSRRRWAWQGRKVGYPCCPSPTGTQVFCLLARAVHGDRVDSSCSSLRAAAESSSGAKTCRVTRASLPRATVTVAGSRLWNQPSRTRRSPTRSRRGWSASHPSMLSDTLVTGPPRWWPATGSKVWSSTAALRLRGHHAPEGGLPGWLGAQARRSSADGESHAAWTGVPPSSKRAESRSAIDDVMVTGLWGQGDKCNHASGHRPESRRSIEQRFRHGPCRGDHIRKAVEQSPPWWRSPDWR